jgi:hypothetical protein
VKYLVLLVFVAPFFLGLAGMRFTLNKLDRMEQIRGWKPGATVQTEVVRQKFQDPQNNAYWIAFSDESIRRPGPHRMNVEPEVWERLQLGDALEVVYLPDDSHPYTRDGIYASDGNFAFDRALLVIEGAMIVGSILGAVITGGVLLLGSRRRQKVNGSHRAGRRRNPPL